MSAVNEDRNPEEEADIQFKPIIELSPVDVKLLEDDEEEVFKIRARLFRFDALTDPPEWKVRGLGDIRMLKHKDSNKIRLLMRREKVLKICCNHFLTKAMKLNPHLSSDKAFIWTTFADFADEEAKAEHLAIRFRNAENAKAFKAKFEELQSQLSDESVEKAKGDCSEETGDKLKTEEKENVEENQEAADADAEDVTKKLDELKVTKSSGDS